MSSSVSQLPYWRGIRNLDSSDETKEGRTGATYLSYDVFLGLSVLGGLFALDHLYLRSPLSFLAKLIINFLTLGTWWIYDATQAVFNRDVVKVFGLSVPGLGPKGIGAGVLANDEPDKKHMSFFIYAIALFFGGIFGLDSFLLGDKFSGIIRIISLITIIFAPIAIIWWLINIFKFMFKTQDLTDQYWEYFGAPPKHSGAYGQVLSKIPILGSIFDMFSPKLVTNIVEKVVTPPLTAGIATIQSGINTAKSGIELGKTALETGSSIASRTLDTIDKTASAASQALQIGPSAAAMTTGLTPPIAQAALNKLEQSGGMIMEQSESGVLPYVLMATLGAIIVSGFVLTYRRLRQNEPPRKNDVPPEPGVLGKSNKKESE